MVTAASPYIEHFQLAIAAFVEGQSILAEAAEQRGYTARPSLAFGYQVITSGFTQIEAVAKRYASQPECAAGAATRPILSDPGFRAAVSACADQLDSAAVYVGVPGARIASALRRWTLNNTPAEAHTIAMAADGAVRTSKMKAGRAA